MLTSLLLVLGGLVLLIVGGELLVRGAARLATLFGLSPLAIGLTIVAYGTSTPELAVSLKAGLTGNDAIAVANVVGSNIFNVLFILGLCALAAPLVVDRALVKIDVPLMIGVSALAWLFALNGRIALWEGLVLTAGLIAYTVTSLKRGAAPADASAPRDPGPGLGKAASIAVGAVGLGILALGARFLVDGAVAMARSLEVSDTVIGLTIVAAGTSLPEVATSIIATVRGQRDIAIGNVVGSNIYNLLGILGVSALFTPGGLSVGTDLLGLDFPVMVVVAAVCFTTFFTGFTIARWEGAVFLGAYVAYTAFLVLKHSGHGAAGAFGTYVGGFFLPLVGLVLLASFVRALPLRRLLPMPGDKGAQG